MLEELGDGELAVRRRGHIDQRAGQAIGSIIARVLTAKLLVIDDTRAPAFTWEQIRVMQWAMAKVRLPRPAESSSRAEYFRSLIVDLWQLGVMPGELRYTFEPFHALGEAEHNAFVASQLPPDAPAGHGLSALSRGLLESYNPAADLFATCDAPKDQDLFLFDPLIGFMLWKERNVYRNFWLGNIRDVIALESGRGPIKKLLLQSRNDHFFLGKSLLLRLVGPFLQDRRGYRGDASDIPTMEVTSTADLLRLGDDLRNACELAPANVAVVFRGQTREHLLPDRSGLVKVVPYSQIRDHSLVLAQWFAFNDMKIDTEGIATSEAVAHDPVIYVLLVLEGLAPVAMTDELVEPEESLRPHRQAGAVLGGAGNLYRNAAGRFIALKIKFAEGYVPRDLPTPRDLFPGPDEDNMLRRLLEQQRDTEDPEVAFPVYRFS